MLVPIWSAMFPVITKRVLYRLSCLNIADTNTGLLLRSQSSCTVPHRPTRQSFYALNALFET
jgi:hypothetical protein